MNTDIVEGNKLIAEFMGGGFMENNVACMYPESLPFWAKRLYDFDTMKIGGYEYHTSWDWLMPVVEKIENTWNPFNDSCIYDEHEYSEFKITNNGVDLDTAGFKNGERKQFQYLESIELKNKSEEIKRNLVWNACVQFITWYNQTKQS